MGAPAFLNSAIERIDEVILDKDREVRLAMTCLLAQGHLLIEDIPGVGKTTLVKSLARICGLQFSRIQFTNDLLPADIVGNSIFDSRNGKFEFHRGPIFAQMVLGDELNRATPKTQSAFLQAMEERALTVDGVTYQLPEPFFFVATQNPRQQIGTFPLPESQLDRFLMRVSLGYPSREAERRLLVENIKQSRTENIDNLSALLDSPRIVQMQTSVRSVTTNENILNYIQDLIEASRHIPGSNGISTRGALGLVRASQAWAFISGRSFVLPEDVQAVALPIMNHRLNPVEDVTGETGLKLAQDIISSVRVD